MQTAGRRVGATAELSACVKFGEDNFDAGEPGLGFQVHGDAAAVVVDFHRIVRMEDDLDVVSEACQRLVHGVVDDLPQAVHEAAGVGGADVHARTFADRLQSFQN
ncbi:uncharacterized 80.2 kDa protein in the 5'region of gyrA and gyrB [Arthrobacter sp. Hiyo8]|nr:uncharacterized 80.2 kDa protein in the 5'region of gyrA and gyrB [Arthrobacter sp. Hiyo8]